MQVQSKFLANDLYLSVDGGGTSCKCSLYNADGDKLGEGRSGASNARLGANRVLNEILLSTQQAFTNAKLDISNIPRTHACFGLAGLELARDQNNFASLETNFKSVILETDGVTACLGAFNGADGAIVITGTGTSAVAMHQNELHNIGGWGFEISDSGSGAVLGQNAVRYALRAAENLELKTELSQYILDFFDNDMSNMVLWAEQAEPKDFALFVSRVFDFKESGDSAAGRLVDTHMQELVQLIEGILSYGSQQFTLLGGLSARSAKLLPSHLIEKYTDCKNDALWGGFLRITKQLSGSRVQVPQKFNDVKMAQTQEGKTYV